MNATKITTIATRALSGALLLAPSVFAETRVARRETKQQVRVAQGVRDGQLTARETSKIETKEATLNAEKKDMRALDGGRLTTKDKATLNQQQNRLSRDIYKQKHDAQHQP